MMLLMIKYAHLISVYVCKYAQAPHTLFVFVAWLAHSLSRFLPIFCSCFICWLLFYVSLLFFLFILRQFDGAHSRVTKCCLVFISVAFMSYIDKISNFFLFDSHFSVSFFIWEITLDASKIS